MFTPVIMPNLSSKRYLAQGIRQEVIKVVPVYKNGGKQESILNTLTQMPRYEYVSLAVQVKKTHLHSLAPRL